MDGTTKTKVLYVITLLSWGGAQKYVHDLVADQQSRESLDLVISGGEQDKGELAEKIVNEGLKLITIKNLVREVNPIKDLAAVWEIKKLIELERPDIVHLNSSKAGVVGSIAARISHHRARVVFTCHGWVFNESLEPWVRLVYLILEKITGRLKDKIICLSAGDQKSAIKNKITTADRLKVIYNGIDTEMQLLPKSLAREELGLSQDDLVVGTIGNFYANKGLKYFIEAVKALPVKGVIIGEGELRPQLEQIITDNKLEEKIVLAGKKENAAKFLPAFDVYLCSSIKEGLPYSILEAMNAGVPVVSTNVGGIGEIIDNGNSGLLVAPSDSQALAEAVRQLLENNDLSELLIANAKDKVQQKFSKVSMVSQTLKEYQKLN